VQYSNEYSWHLEERKANVMSMCSWDLFEAGGRTVRLQQARSSISTAHYSRPFDFLQWHCKQTYIWSKQLLLRITGPACLRTQWNLLTLRPMRCYRRIGSVIFTVQVNFSSAHHDLMWRTKTLLYVFLISDLDGTELSSLHYGSFTAV
jgi:hypothetical protein